MRALAIRRGKWLSKPAREAPFFVLLSGRTEAVRLETSLPGVFAVGDVRGGNVKRVASAVGEGSIAVSFVHKTLRE